MLAPPDGIVALILAIYFMPSVPDGIVVKMLRLSLASGEVRIWVPASVLMLKNISSRVGSFGVRLTVLIF